MDNGKPFIPHQLEPYRDYNSDAIVRKRQTPFQQIMAEFNAAYDASPHLFDTQEELDEFQLKLMLKTIERVAEVDEEANPGSIERRIAGAKRFGFG